jgi:hypothetical protein
MRPRSLPPQGEGAVVSPELYRLLYRRIFRREQVEWARYHDEASSRAVIEMLDEMAGRPNFSTLARIIWELRLPVSVEHQ